MAHCADDNKKEPTAKWAWKQHWFFIMIFVWETREKIEKSNQISRSPQFPIVIAPSKRLEGNKRQRYLWANHYCSEERVPVQLIGEIRCTLRCEWRVEFENESESCRCYQLFQIRQYEYTPASYPQSARQKREEDDTANKTWAAKVVTLSSFAEFCVKVMYTVAITATERTTQNVAIMFFWRSKEESILHLLLWCECVQKPFEISFHAATWGCCVRKGTLVQMRRRE